LSNFLKEKEMKSTKWFVAVMFIASMFITSCSNNENDDELKLYENREIYADGDSGGGNNPGTTPPPPPPPTGSGG